MSWPAQAAVTHATAWVTYTTDLLLTILEVGKFKIKEPSSLDPAEDFLPGLQTPVSLLYPHLVSSHKGAYLIIGASP